MKRRMECLVEKRDGRREWLRATKLARSITLALEAVGAGERFRAFELASAVLSGLRRPSGPIARCENDRRPVRVTEIAAAVEHTLTAAGFPHAAATYAQCGAEQRRRRSVLVAAPPAVSRFGFDLPPDPRLS